MPEEIVQAPPTQEGEPGAGGEKAPESGVTPPAPTEAPLTREEVKELLAEEGKRFQSHFQSVADKQVAAARREAQAEVAELRKFLVELDPDKAKELELAGYRKRDQGQAAEGEAQRQRDENTRIYYGPIQESLKELGVSEKEVDFAMDAPDFATAHQRLQVSITKALKGKEAKLRADHQQALKDHEARVRKDLGLDKVDNSLSMGTGRIPTLAELRDASPQVFQAKLKSGEWVKGRPKQ